MKFTIEIDPEINPDAVGEYLRSTFFDEKVIFEGSPYAHRETGCYSAFDWQSDVETLEEIRVEDTTCEGCQRPDASADPQGGMHSMDYVCSCTYAVCWTRGKKLVKAASTPSSLCVEIECRYYWDGDGTLVFILPGGKYLVNADCKKDHDWYLTEDPEDF